MSENASTAPGDRIELLETFIRIAEVGGVGAAARKMGVTQPTASRRLQQLEGLVGAKLVERGAKLSLTPAGVRLLPDAREVAARWRAIQEAALAEAGGQGALVGAVRVLATRGLGSAFLPPLTAMFLARHPQARVELRFDEACEAGREEAAREALAQGGADFAVAEGREGGGAGEGARLIGVTRQALYASPEWAYRLSLETGADAAHCEPPVLDGASVVTAEPLHEPQLTLENAAGARHDVRVEPLAAVTDLEPVLDLALAGAGLALLPTWRAAPLVAEGRLVRVSAGWTAGAFAVRAIWGPSRFRTAVAVAFFEEVAAGLAGVFAEEAR